MIKNNAFSGFSVGIFEDHNYDDDEDVMDDAPIHQEYAMR